MSYKLLLYQLVGFALLGLSCQSEAVVGSSLATGGGNTKQTTPAATAVIISPSAAMKRFSGSSYIDETSAVDFAQPFTDLNPKLLSFADNPIQGYLGVIPFQVTNTKSDDPNFAIIGTIAGSKIGSATDFYIYVDKNDLANVVRHYSQLLGPVG